MTQEPPPLARQIWAVDWAAKHIDAKKGRIDTHAMRESERERVEQALIAAAETLRTLEFTRETAR